MRGLQSVQRVHNLRYRHPGDLRGTYKHGASPPSGIMAMLKIGIETCLVIALLLIATPGVATYGRKNGYQQIAISVVGGATC